MTKIHVAMLMAIEALLLCAVSATASRNSSGTMSAINGPYTAGSVISKTALNARFSDIETEITNSVDKGGRTTMTAPLPLSNGSAALPSLTFGSDTDTGLYRIGADNLGVTIGGTKKLDLTSSLFTVTPAITLTGGITGSTALAGLLTATNAGATSLKGLSGAAGSATDISVGRSASEARIGVSAGANNYASGSAAGDIILGTLGTKLWIDTNSGSGTPSLTIAAANGVVGINNGVAADGSGLKHQSVAGCATAAAIGATCTSTLTWTTTFANASYQAVCSCNAVTSGLPIIRSYTNSGDGISITLTTMAMTAAAAQCTVITCMAAHD